MKVVIDASAAIEIALDGSHATRLSAFLATSDEVLAPELLLAEVVNSIWKYHHFENLEVDLCERALKFVTELVPVLVSHTELYSQAFLLSRSEPRRAAYDMFYLALAQREDAVLLTMDRSLKKEAARRGIRVA